MATLRKRGSKWHVQIRRSGHTQTRSFSHKTDAESWTRLIERKIDTGEINNTSAGSSSTSVGDLLKRYSEEVLPNKKSAKVETYIIRQFQRHRLETLLACEVAGPDISRYRDERLCLVKEGTVHRELSVLRHCFEVARKEWGIPLKTNPVSEITMPSPGRPRERRTTQDELSDLHLACSHPILWQIITIAIETAMRRGEIVAMQWGHINWENGTLYIPDTKNGYPRTIPLTPKAITVLKELPQNEVHVMNITGNAIRLAWERLKMKAGVSDLRFHDLRHEAVSRFFEMGLSVPEVALISGHKDPRMLFRYTHLRAEDVGKKFRSL
jgi:integrase